MVRFPGKVLHGKYDRYQHLLARHHNDDGLVTINYYAGMLHRNIHQGTSRSLQFLAINSCLLPAKQLRETY